jgi:transcriptional regulator with XRE-family HTH domain
MNANRSVSPIDKFIGQRIRSRRLQLDISQADLGGALGISFQQIQKYEKGTNRVSTATLIEIAKVLEIEPQHFYVGAPGFGKIYKGQSSEVDAFMSTKDGLMIARSFVAIADPNIRHAVASSIANISRAMATKPRALQAAE